MDDQEQDNRIEALNCAVRHKLKDQTTEDIVKSAEKYFNFLQGKPSD